MLELKISKIPSIRTIISALFVTEKNWYLKYPSIKYWLKINFSTSTYHTMECDAATNKTEMAVSHEEKIEMGLKILRCKDM